jgi:serine/threonine protein kinase
MRELVFCKHSFEMHDGQQVFSHTDVVWRDGDEYYQAKSYVQRRVETLPLNQLLGQRIPMHLFRGRWYGDFTELPRCPAGAYEKKPTIVVKDEEDFRLSPEEAARKPTHMGNLLVTEALLYENTLKYLPHPNIGKYYGCIREGESLVAVCLKRYETSLYSAVKRKDDIDTVRILRGLRDGVDFLHKQLGIVHNDLTPHSIMLDDLGNAVIADFGFATLEGERVMGGQSTLNASDHSKLALFENDDEEYTRIVEWLIEHYPHKFGKLDR